MRRPERQARRAWVLDPTLFGLAITFLGALTVSLFVYGRLYDQWALYGLSALSLLPAFWLFYRRAEAMHTARRDARGRR
jgi:hypothetical protein